MKNFEPVYKELEKLFINKLPEYIEKINKEHNDGIILKPFENKSLEENCIKTPSFSFKFEETEYEEKVSVNSSLNYSTHSPRILKGVISMFQGSSLFQSSAV